MYGQEGIGAETPLTFRPLPTYGSAQLTGDSASRWVGPG